MDKLIKIEIKQDRAVYRLPYSMEVIETYPLPPYSTVLGFIHSILGLREAIWGINVSVQGEYGGLFRDYAHFHKYTMGMREGKIYPVIVTSLIDIYLVVHIKMPQEEWHERLLCALHDPPYFPYLGHPEDLITELRVTEVEETFLSSQKSYENGLELPLNAYLPIEQAMHYDLDGIKYLLPSYYQKQEVFSKEETCFRMFKLIPVFYVQKNAPIIGDILIDNDGVPLWWMMTKS